MKKLLLLGLVAVYSYSTEITLGVVPQQSPLKLSKKWTKVTNYLYKETGIKVIFKTQRSIPKFEKELYAGKYDISYMNPYHFIVANKRQGYEAFTRAKKNIVGIVLAKEKKIDFSKDNLKRKNISFSCTKCLCCYFVTKI